MTPYCPEVRFVDLDAMGIVNNATYLTYLEQARIHFFSELVGAEWDWHAGGVVVARHAIDYRLPLRLNDVPEIHTWTVKYVIRLQGASHAFEVARAETVLVGYDHLRGVSVDIPALWREAFAQGRTGVPLP
jgi:acyl-CoA thioester hydrolase